MRRYKHSAAIVQHHQFGWDQRNIRGFGFYPQVEWFYLRPRFSLILTTGDKYPVLWQRLSVATSQHNHHPIVIWYATKRCVTS